MRHISLFVVLAAALVVAIPGLALADEGTGTTPSYDPAPTTSTPTPPDPEPVPTPTTSTPTTAVPVPPPSRVAASTRASTWAGLLLVTSTARAMPGPGGKPIKLVQPISPLGAGPVWLQVRGVKIVRGVRWVQMLLPVRPNNTTGWMRATDFVFREIHLRIDIDVGARTLALYRGSTRLKLFKVAVGMPTTPTPTGRFAIAEVIPTGDPKAFLGPIVMPLTAYSNVLNEFAGGNGRVAIHGTSLPDLIGKPVSHGCIRMHNANVRVLSRMASSGATVTIHG
ncbi:MAG: L,D-transpeptidase [Miltoncostaeaceae bacterium]